MGTCQLLFLLPVGNLFLVVPLMQLVDLAIELREQTPPPGMCITVIPVIAVHSYLYPKR
jgi:hypothetical protein